MIRIFLVCIVPLLLPSLFYFGWLLWQQRQTGLEYSQLLRRIPWVWTLSAGFVLMIILGLVFGFGDGATPGAQYHAPRFEDGKIIPGGFVDAPDQP